MRAIPTSYIKGDLVLAENLYNKEGAVLLKKGATINERIVKKINEMGIFTVYITDAFSPDIDLDRIVDINMRIKGVNLLKEVYESVKMGKEISSYFPKILQLFDSVYDEILNARERQINYIDIKSVDNYTYGHALNVAILSTILGIECGVKMPQLKSLFVGASLFDIGMMMIPQDGIQSPDGLDDFQTEMLKKHVQLGYDYLRNMIDADAFVKNIALTHHERADGTGYPNKMNAGNIHLFSKIVGICDVYDAMTSDRVYKRAVPPNEAIEYLMGSAGQQFDLEITEKFCKKINPYPEGSLVQLNTGDIAVVRKVTRDMPMRPKISIINNVGAKLVMKDIDLYETRNLVIVGPYY